MASRPSSNLVILLSIHPEYAQAILRRKKLVEFRKYRFSSQVKHAIIYETRPVMKITGFFEITAVDEGTPLQVWQKYGAIGSTDRDGFFSYYGSHKNAVAISIGHVTKLVEPIALSELDFNARPPQSFQYLPDGCLEKLKAAALNIRASIY